VATLVAVRARFLRLCVRLSPAATQPVEFSLIALVESLVALACSFCSLANPLEDFSSAAASRCRVSSLAAPSTSTTPIPGMSILIALGFYPINITCIYVYL